MMNNELLFSKMCENVWNVYTHFNDELSRTIYQCRLLYSMTRDSRVFVQLYDRLGFMPCLKEFCGAKEYYIFGAGIRGREALLLFKSLSIEISGFIDNDVEKIGKLFEGYRVYALSEINPKENVCIYISTLKHRDEIYSQLLEYGFGAQNVLDDKLYRNKITELSFNQYFDIEEMKITSNEVFVDAGGYNGDTVKNFLHWATYGFKKIYCFEPEPDFVRIYGKQIKNLSPGKIELIERGLWSSDGELSFENAKGMASKISDNGFIKVKVTKMDSILADESVSFIKMDIEGSELQALIGAESIIRKNRPKLAISVYHKYEDIFTIPEYLLTLHSDYNFMLRCYGIGNADTVLYAW